ncbi:ras guanine nucleotide exchange factor Y isoform X5 [Drosophila mauritiana]|uniref:Ras guanine nucleotide exchange factor Y isoform X5 n=1 Tax=Drosophila mauritiana TaxID=7226 RepID=A0A6P8K8E8_DROMA|nr:ras guanine nucleotide exchange factor Y isoform X5 [Drosophila mauritiana]
MRRNLRLDWRALALLGALLSFIIAWRGLVSAMPLMAMDNNLTDSSGSTYTSTSKYNSTNNSNLFSNSYLQSDHSRSSLVPSAVSERSVNQPTNQSINAEFNQSLSTHPTAITSTPQTQTQTQIQSQYPSQAEDSDQLEEPLGFVISAMPNEHLAVLSRTERSIRHQNQQQQKKHHHHHQQQQQQPMSPADNNFIGSKSKRLSNPRSSLNINSSSSNTPISNLDRNERSTVPQSHLAWTSRKIQLYIKNRILQILRDGVVNGTQDENSEFTILQRSTVDVGRIKLQSVATCLYLCMDACGVPYGSPLVVAERLHRRLRLQREHGSSELQHILLHVPLSGEAGLLPGPEWQWTAPAHPDPGQPIAGQAEHLHERHHGDGAAGAGRAADRQEFWCQSRQARRAATL